MEWKREAQEKLRRYNAMRQAAENIPAQIELLRRESADLQGINYDTKVKNGPSRREEALLNNIAKRQELEWALGRVQQWLDITDRGLDALSREERLVLQRFFLYPEKGAAEILCEELGVEQATVYRKRDRAIYHFTVALYGIPELHDGCVLPGRI